MDRKDIFMSGFKSKIGYSFTYKDLNELEAIINFYEQQCKKQNEAINKAIEYINNQMIYYDDDGDCGVDCECDGFKLLDILKEVE